MNVTGAIVSVAPTVKGGYQGQSGWIYTYMMTIQGPSGQQKTGEIGSTQSPYPMNPGEQITVTETQSQYGLRFKRVQEQQGGSGRNSDDPKTVEGKCIHGVVTAGIASGQLRCTNDVDIKHWVDIIMGRIQLAPTSNAPAPNSTPGYQGTPEQTMQQQCDDGCSDPAEAEVPW